MVHPDSLHLPNAERDSAGGAVLPEVRARNEEGGGTKRVGDERRGERTRRAGHCRPSARARTSRRTREIVAAAAYPPDMHRVHADHDLSQVRPVKVLDLVGKHDVFDARERVLALRAPAHRVAAKPHRLDACQDVEHKRVDRQLATPDRNGLEHDAVAARERVERIDLARGLHRLAVVARRLELARAAQRAHRVRHLVRLARRLAVCLRTNPMQPILRLFGWEEVALARCAGGHRRLALVRLNPPSVSLLVAVGNDERAWCARAGKERVGGAGESRGERDAHDVLTMHLSSVLRVQRGPAVASGCRPLVQELAEKVGRAVHGLQDVVPSSGRQNMGHVEGREERWRRDTRSR